MNFKKMMKRGQEGFTLVELIVVIAILGILGGIAVPAYSGYVEKANKGADIALLGEIEHALTLAGYNGTFQNGESGYITLSTAGVVATGANADAAMKATFGENYADTLKLKYAHWGNNGMLSSLLNSADPKATAQNVLSSPYIAGNYSVEQLMGEVEDLTTVASGVLADAFGAASGDSSKAYDKVASFFENGTTNTFTDAFAEVYGDNADKSKLTETELANLMVMASAKEWSKNDGTGISKIGEMVGNYAILVAFAATDAGQSDQNVADAYKELQETIKSKENASMQNAMNALAKCQEVMGKNEAFNNWYGQDGMNSALQAFSDIMSAADAATVTPEDMNNGALFTEGKGLELFNNYLANAEMVSGMTGDQIAALKASASAEGNVVVSYCQNATMVEIANTITES